MFGKVVSLSFALVLASAAGFSFGGPAASSVDLSSLSPVSHRDLALPTSTQSAASKIGPQHYDVPTAPLPPAVWPGLLLLTTLGGVKLIHHTRRRLVNG